MPYICVVFQILHNMNRKPILRHLKQNDKNVLLYSVEDYFCCSTGKHTYILHIFGSDGNEIEYFAFSSFIAAYDFLKTNYDGV